jgi:hypothetical protein
MPRAAIPGFPGAACNSVRPGLCAIRQASACSRAPDPTIRTFTRRVYFGLRGATLTTVKLALLVPAICAAAVLTGSASARSSPRIQKLAPVPADTKAAKAATIRLSDLTPGWKGGTARPDNSAPDCKKNFSAYTITGDAEADFTQGAAAITSTVQFFPSRRQALGDFGVDTPPGIAACEGAALRSGIGPSAKLVFARQVVPPKVGDHAAAYDFAVRVNGIEYFIDVVNFVRGRAYGSLITLDPDAPLPGSTLLATLMDQRLSDALA